MPAVAAPVASYIPAVAHGGLVFTSGQLPFVDGALPETGKVGADVPEDDAIAFAEIACLNALAAVKSVIGDLDRGRGDETLDPKRSLLSEQYEGTFAEYVAVPARNLVPLPDGISFEDAACLPVAWGTAYRMLATQAKLRAGDTVLVQGSAGGVNSAAIKLAVAMGATVYATSRTDEKLALAESWGARGIADGARLPEQVDYVIDNVGEATWSHSVKSLRPGGAIVTCGATTGMNPSADLGRIFYQQKRVLGSTMCTLTELQQLVRVMENTGVRPLIDSTVSLENIRDGFETLLGGDVRGKIVVRVAEDD